MTSLMSIASGRGTIERGGFSRMCACVGVRIRMQWGYHAADQKENEFLKCLVYNVYCCFTAAQGLQRGPDLLSQQSSEILIVD